MFKVLAAAFLAPFAYKAADSQVTQTSAASEAIGATVDHATVVHLHGQHFSRDQVRELIEHINEESRRGGKVIVT